MSAISYRRCASIFFVLALSLALAFACTPFALAQTRSDDADGEGSRALPSEFYLTNLGYVTSAKLQSPWGTCWAFAVAAAIESSILKASAELSATQDMPTSSTPEEKGGSLPEDAAEDASEQVTNTEGLNHPMAAIRSAAVSAKSDDSTLSSALDDANTSAGGAGGIDVSMDEPDFSNLVDDVDVSERAIGWFVHEPQSEQSGASQAGEGYVRKSSDPLTQFEGGNFSIAAAMLVAGQALVSEQSAPYRYNGYDGSGTAWFAASGGGRSADARLEDWSLPGEFRTGVDVGWHVSGVLELESPAILDTDISSGMSIYKGYDTQATEQIKETLLNVGAVAICLNSELSLPSELSSDSISSDTLGEAIDYSTWSQYSSADSFMLNHAVTIVGWDDSYPAEAFRNTSGATPPSAGAWLCKNNWGSGRIVEENGGSDDLVGWGIREGGSSSASDATGFFWLSFFDHTISTPVAFKVSPNDDANLYQYDYLGASEFFKPTTYTSDVLVANVFQAENTELIESVGSWTFDADETVHTYVYALGESSGEVVDGEQFLEALASSTLLAEGTDTFSVAGYHEVALDEPVMLYAGERFVVMQQIEGMATNLFGEEEAVSYLSLEAAFTDTMDYENVASKPNVVSNAGESFVSIYGPQDWRSVDEYNDWYADLKAQNSQNVDVIFGNALIKAITKNTSMASDDRLYEHAKLEPVTHE